MYKLNYLLSSSAITLIFISTITSECKLILALKVPNDFISFSSCIIEGFTSIFSFSKINFDISVGLTEPYSSLFSVLNFFIKYSLLLIVS